MTVTERPHTLTPHGALTPALPQDPPSSPAPPHGSSPGTPGTPAPPGRTSRPRALPPQPGPAGRPASAPPLQNRAAVAFGARNAKEMRRVTSNFHSVSWTLLDFPSISVSPRAVSFSLSSHWILFHLPFCSEAPGACPAHPARWD